MIVKTISAIDPDALQNTLQGMWDEIAAMRRTLENVALAPRPEWMTVADYAAFIGRSERTVKRMFDAGKVETKRVGNVLMIRV